jgi:hypothetical protein
MAGPGSDRHARHLGQALHHPGPDLHPPRAGLPPAGPRPPARRSRRSRHHLRAGAHRPSRREHRPPPLPAQRRVPERAELGQGRLHAAGLDHRRPGHGRPGLAHAHGMPGGGALDFAALVEHRHVQARGARHRRLCPRPQPVQDRHRPLRGHRGTAGAHGRQPVHDGRGTHHDRRRHRPRREALGGLGHRQVPRHRAHAPGGQRRDGHPRRQGHLPRPQQLHGPRLPADSRWRSRSRAPTS